MKKLILTILTVAIASTVFAQVERKVNRFGKGRGDKAKAELLNGKIAQKLGITDEQKAQLKESTKSTKEKMQALKQNKDITVGEYEKQRAAIMEEYKLKVNEVLTDEQEAQLQEMKNKFQARKEKGNDNNEKNGRGNRRRESFRG